MVERWHLCGGAGAPVAGSGWRWPRAGCAAARGAGATGREGGGGINRERELGNILVLLLKIEW